MWRMVANKMALRVTHLNNGPVLTTQSLMHCCTCLGSWHTASEMIDQQRRYNVQGDTKRPSQIDVMSINTRRGAGQLVSDQSRRMPVAVTLRKPKCGSERFKQLLHTNRMQCSPNKRGRHSKRKGSMGNSMGFRTSFCNTMH